MFMYLIVNGAYRDRGPLVISANRARRAGLYPRALAARDNSNFSNSQCPTLSEEKPQTHYPAACKIPKSHHKPHAQTDFVIGRQPPKFTEFADMIVAAREKKFPGLQIVAFSFESWQRGNIIPISRGRPRTCDILKYKSLQPKTKTKVKNERDQKRKQFQEYPPLSDEQASDIFDACTTCGYPHCCPVEQANLAYNDADFECDGNCGKQTQPAQRLPRHSYKPSSMMIIT